MKKPLLYHFNNFESFNSKKLSSNVDNTKYTIGVKEEGSVEFNGTPEIDYQSLVYIKDTQQHWTHGQLYNGGDIPTKISDLEGFEELAKTSDLENTNSIIEDNELVVATALNNVNSRIEILENIPYDDFSTKVELSGKQDTLISGTNIKTINGTSILGSGDIIIESGSSNANVQAVDTGDIIDDVAVDYATKTYVDGLIGDINSVLESIIGGGH